MFTHKYRIIENGSESFEPQIKRWYWPFWLPLFYRIVYGDCYWIVTTKTLIEAEIMIDEEITTNSHFVVHEYPRKER